MRDYQLHRLADEDFEDLVTLICHKELGTGTFSFAKGPDGGRDARFVGTAERFPSSKSPWSGTFIVQAKHTTNPAASCAERTFFGNRSSVINKELPKIKRLRQAGEVDNYLLFTNRTTPAGADARIEAYIKDEAGIPNVKLLGKEFIERRLGQLDRDREVRRILRLAELRSPFLFYATDLKDLLVAFQEAKLIEKAAGYAASFDFEPLATKNERNRLSKEYFEHIKQVSAPYFAQITRFLKNPINMDLTDQYDCVVAEFNNKIMVRRDDFDAFEEIFDFLYDELHNTDPTFQAEKCGRLLWTLLHYMYWICDLGLKC